MAATGEAVHRPSDPPLCLRLGEVLLKRCFQMLRQEGKGRRKASASLSGSAPPPVTSSRDPKLSEAVLKVSSVSLEQSVWTMTKEDSNPPPQNDFPITYLSKKD